MSDSALQMTSPDQHQHERIAKITRGLKRRHAAETRLKAYGISAIIIAVGFLAVLLVSIIVDGYTALQQTKIALNVTIPIAEISGDDGRLSLEKSRKFNWDGIVKKALYAEYPRIVQRDQRDQRGQRDLGQILSDNAGFVLRRNIEKNPPIIGQDNIAMSIWVSTSDDVDMLMKGRINRNVDEAERRLSDQQIAWVDELAEQGKIKRHFNSDFFTQADSREPESAGILGAVVGSALTLLITVLLALPLAIMAAVYLEYFAPQGKLTDFIEVNINNLAAVPSIVFGLLGLAVFIGFFGMPRSVPLVGGMVLALMTLPTIIIATRASIRAVPPSIREAALGLGASRMQAAIDHVLPLAAPGVLTGTIIGIAQALGETAPLIMIGMVAFIADVPASVTDPATALPVQIFIWSDSAERAFYERSSLAIFILLTFLVAMNILAVILRKKFEKRWS
jgi:phosphate transport system permease protein